MRSNCNSQPIKGPAVFVTNAIFMCKMCLKNSNKYLKKKFENIFSFFWGQRGPWLANMAQSPSPLTNEICQLSFIPSQPYVFNI